MDIIYIYPEENVYIKRYVQQFVLSLSLFFPFPPRFPFLYNISHFSALDE